MEFTKPSMFWPELYLVKGQCCSFLCLGACIYMNKRAVCTTRSPYITARPLPSLTQKGHIKNMPSSFMHVCKYFGVVVLCHTSYVGVGRWRWFWLCLFVCLFWCWFIPPLPLYHFGAHTRPHTHPHTEIHILKPPSLFLSYTHTHTHNTTKFGSWCYTNTLVLPAGIHTHFFKNLVHI